MDNWISAFLEAKAAELDVARNTQLAYGRDLSDFAGWLTARGLHFSSASRDNVESYLIDCNAQGLSRATRARRLSSIRQLFRFVYEEGWRSDHPALSIKGPGRTKSLPQVLSMREVDALLTAATSVGRNKKDQLRNICLMQLLYATGMRVSELVSVPVAATRGNPEMLLVTGKGNKERLVPLSPPARSCLSAWLEIRDANEDLGRTRGEAPSKYLFPSNGASGFLTRHRFYILVKEIAIRAGLDPDKVTPHKLRHAFATHLLAGGADLRVIQTLLGHADVSSTEIYTHVLKERLTDLVMDHHPLASKPDTN
jgi:integrase/recombinase XerD